MKLKDNFIKTLKEKPQSEWSGSLGSVLEERERGKRKSFSLSEAGMEVGHGADRQAGSHVTDK